MSEYAISISQLNDFIFCPASIYFHGLDAETEKMTYQDSFQLNGTAAHETVDNGRYSTRKDMMQGIYVYSAEYNLMGKLDLFDARKGILTERKKKIRTVYDGYIFQIWAQCLSLREMGYTVRELRLYSMDDNKTHAVTLPEADPEMFSRFVTLLEAMQAFSLSSFHQENRQKCERCIYEPLCPYSALKE